MAPLEIPTRFGAIELYALLSERPEIRLLDVRGAGEFATAHIPGAYNVPLDTLAEHAAQIHARVADPVVLVCQSGSRARAADEALRAAGMPNLHVLDGGMRDWMAAGLPVQRGEERVSLERQVRIAAGSLVATGAALALLADPLAALLPLLVGSGLVYAGVTDSCAMAMALSRLPYNRRDTCDVGAMVHALALHTPATGIPTASGSGGAAVRSCTA
jgi:rhodanese-related sulfurtransferase